MLSVVVAEVVPMGRVPPPEMRRGVCVLAMISESSASVVGRWVMMRTSTDLKTWSNTQLAAAGAQGTFGTRVYWTRLASSDRAWVPEVTVTDPIPWRIVGADVEGRNIQGRDA